ncbi:MAG: hypothetical protein JO295_07060 [Verrucomicrobia bacterium]|nr:hypothetical protein [Verrucomicrobiota bacterium]
MLQEIEKLLVLQDRDQQLKKLHHEQTALPTEKKKLADKLAAARATADAARQRLRDNEVERRKLELEVEAKQGAIARFRQQQQGTRKNEEYQALSHEITHAESQIRALEDRELELMEAAEQLQAPLQSAEAEAKRVESVTREQTAKLEAGATGLSDRIATLEADRAAQAAALPEEVHDLYQRLFKQKGDAAVVPLEAEICGGCHMRTPAQTVILLRAERQLVQCPNCARILYRAL